MEVHGFTLDSYPIIDGLITFNQYSKLLEVSFL